MTDDLHAFYVARVNALVTAGRDSDAEALAAEYDRYPLTANAKDGRTTRRAGPAAGHCRNDGRAPAAGRDERLRCRRLRRLLRG
jgi:hypothetical protein